MTLKTVLRNFLNHVESIEYRRKLGEDQYETEFQKLKVLTETLKHDEDYQSSEGELDVNRRKNRYKDILPYDCTRVVLSEYPGVPGSDYINANYIKGASGSLAYIGSQGPLPHTVADFWRMIWECEVQVIVMACNERESGKYKCECYWPNEGEQRQYGNITVEMVKWKQVCPDFLVRTLRSCCGDDERKICQFHYTTWPDHGVPSTVQPILDLVRLVRDCQASEALPVLVHCSAGCGRTGTVCAIDYVWGLMRLGKLQESFSLFDVISDMRRQRIAMVQTKEQYILVHRAVMSLFEQQLRVIDTHTYENLDEDGEPLVLKELQKDDLLDGLYEDVMSGQPMDPSDSLKKEEIVQECLENAMDPSSANNKKGRRNSQILQQLCREESVKRLISGWNKNSGTKMDDEHFLESLSTAAVDKSVLQNSVQDTNEILVQKDTRIKKDAQNDGAKSEKLVGKATVIRRPSIARLKALFEKSHGSDAYSSSSELRRRRPLGRSHTLHASRGCSSPSEEDSETRKMVERVLRQQLGNKKRAENVKLGESRTVAFPPEQVSGYGEDSKSEIAPPRIHRKMSDCPRLEKTGSWYSDGFGKSSSQQVVVASTGIVPQLASTANVARSQISDVVQPSIARPILPRDSCNNLPPELPVKKKSISKTQLSSNVEDLAKKRVESIYDTPRNLILQDLPPQLPEKKHIGKLTASKLGMWNAGESNSSKTVKSDVDIVKDSEDYSAKNRFPIDSSNIHATARSLIDRYTNVNLTTKKNIEQIENSIKQHPRGAIIDLTSRTSFVENNMRPADRHACNNNIRVGRKDSGAGYEPVWVHKSDVGKDGSPGEIKKSTNNVDTSESDLNKNLLLHSPPPRTRRPHLTRSVLKTKSESQQTVESVPNISNDQEINKAVKDLNTIGYLLDALASQTLDDLKKEKSLLDESDNFIAKMTSKPILDSTVRPELPVKQKSVGKHVDVSGLSDRGSVSFPSSPQKTTSELPNFDDVFATVCSPQLSREPLETERTHVVQEDRDLSSKQPDRRTMFPAEYEVIYPLQKSASAPHSTVMFSEQLSSGLGHLRHSVMVPKNSNYSQEIEEALQEKEQNFAPPKPPRTFAHVSHQSFGSGRFDGGRLLVSVASPKHMKSEELKKANENSIKNGAQSDRPCTSNPSSLYYCPELQQSPPPYKNAPNPHYNTPSHEFDPQSGDPVRFGQPHVHRPQQPKTTHAPDSVLPCSPAVERQHSAPPPNLSWSQMHSSTPEYGKIPVVPVYTTVRADFDRHHVQWDRSVDAQQQFKNVKNYENIYDMPKECYARTLQGSNPLRHSQSDVSVYAVLREMKQVEDVPSPLYSQVVKSRRHRRSQDDIDIRPVAPPRSKKQITVKRYGEGTSPNDGGFSTGVPCEGRGTWHSDSEEEAPAVPVKTKGAYIPVDPESYKASPKKSASGNGGLGGTLSRALGKLTLLTKLTGKEQNNHQVKFGRGTGGPTTSTTKDDSPVKKVPHGLRSPVFSFPHRLQRKPKGPREPTEQWTQV